MSAITLAELKGITLSQQAGASLVSQLYLALRLQILNKQLTSGTRLPSSRILAGQLKVGRNTVIAALDQLQAEGYLRLKPGAGCFVAEQIPDFWKPGIKASSQLGSELVSTAERNQQAPAGASHNQTFCVGVPDLRAFPHKIWNRLAQQQSFSGRQSLMGFGDPEGYWPLRQAVANYASSSRAVNCQPEQVLITNGAQQGLELACRVLLQAGDVSAIEEPGYRGMRRALQAANRSILPLGVDRQGLLVDQLRAAQPVPKLAYVTPANQYPMGSVLSLERKSALLDWATSQQSWIIEDDYDSEYHYHHRPLASLQGIDSQQRVIYVGSFSKVLFPALRLGYLILPPQLMPQFVQAKQQTAGETPLHSQAVTAAFILEGHFNRHLRKMRILYADKLQYLLRRSQALSPWLRCHSGGAGLHVVMEFVVPMDEDEIARQLLQRGFQCSVLKQYFLGLESRQGLVLGFANSSLNDIEMGLQALEHIFTAYQARTGPT